MGSVQLAARVVDFSRPDIGEREIAEVVAALGSGWLSTGPRVREFERAFAERIGARHAVAVNSCTAALHLSLLASGVGPGDEVITTPLTFCSTANTIIHAGATPVFADIDPITMNLDPSAAEGAITDRTRALLPVHYAGRPAEARAFRALADRRGLGLVEDAAHCVAGAEGGQNIGTIADFTCFSFYATKNLTTGEGGMITTSSAERADWMRQASLHGMSRDGWARYSGTGTPLYDVVTPGFKCNMMDLQAAIGLGQLARLDAMQARRDDIWRRYDAGLTGLPLSLPPQPAAGSVHARHLYTVLVDPERAGMTRDQLYERLRAHGIVTSVHFRAVHLFSYYRQRFGYRPGAFPHAERVSAQTLSLPLSPVLTDADVDHVIASVHEALAV